VNASTAADRQVTAEGLSRTTEYHWRVRGTNAGGPGTWTRGVFTTTDRAARRYYVKDHLGSIRAVVDPDAPGTGAEKVVETRDYYPFGLRMPGRSVTEGTPAAEDYTGHELDGEANSSAVHTGMHYAGARYYMSALGRFGVVDPMADSYLSHSAYHYAANNPMRITDPSGAFWVDKTINQGIRANRFPAWGGVAWRAMEQGLSFGGYAGQAGSWNVFSWREMMVSGVTKYSALDPGNAEYYQKILGSAGSFFGGPNLLRGYTTAQATLSSIDIYRVLRADGVAFRALLQANPLVETGDGTFQLLSQTSGTSTIRLNSSIERAWSKNMSESEILEKFADQIGVVQSVTTFFLKEHTFDEAVEKTQMFLDDAKNVKDSEEACQFAADALSFFTTSDC